MAIPDYQSVMLPVLVAAARGEVRISAVTEELATNLGLTPEEKAQLLPSGKQAVFANRVNWAKTYLTQAGLLETTRRAHFRILPRGAEVLKSSPHRIDNTFLNQFPEFRAFKERARSSQDGTPDPLPNSEPISLTSEADTPDEVMRRAQSQIHSALAKELLDRIRAASPEFFERLIVNLLLGMGYGGAQRQDAGRALGRAGDDGVDGVIDQDALGLDRVYIQAKRYAEGNNVGSAAIRDFFGSLDRHKAAKGLFVTTSAFSNSARETAEHLSKRIVLVDGELLTALMIRHDVGCRVEDTLYIKKLDEEFFD